MKQAWSNLSGLSVTLTESERPLGRLNGVFMNPENGQIIAFLVGISRVLVPVDIEYWNHDHVQVASREVLISPYEILRIQDFGLRRCFINTKSVRSKSGKRFGKVQDFTIDTQTSSVINFSTSKGVLGFKWDRRLFPTKDISEVTENSIILSVEPEQMEGLLKHQSLLQSPHQV